jgi:hypothetical protein
MKHYLLAGLCALILTACEATDPAAPGNGAGGGAPGSAFAGGQMTAAAGTPKVGGVPTTMLVTSPRVVRQGATLGEADLQQLLVGNTIKQVDDQYWAYFGSGGQLKGLLVNLTEDGSYSFAGGQVCKSWPTWATGMRLCYRVLSLGDARYRFSGLGVDSFDVVISRGNPQNL